MIRPRKILFVPELELDPTQGPFVVSVKGQFPHLDYSFVLRDIYPQIPALNPFSAYQAIQREFERINSTLAQQLHLRSACELPSVQNDEQALSLLQVLFDPTTYFTDGLWRRLSNSYDPKPGGSIIVGDTRPFPLRLASPEKLLHTLGWIDSNLKIGIENLLVSKGVSPSIIKQIVLSTLKIYVYLVKQQDYKLARNMTFNHSMFLQDRILSLVFGDQLYLSPGRLQKEGALANEIALQLLKGLGRLSLKQLCTLSVFMGIIWANADEIQRSFIANSNAALGDIQNQLNIQSVNWGVNHVDRFLSEIEKNSPFTIAVILDDNGESVFDLALFQYLLNEFDRLGVIFVVNRYPVSTNIAFDTFQILLNDSYFAGLREAIQQNRVKLCVEYQVFRSFEQSFLKHETRQIIEQSQLVYIKGANFFETFQIPNAIRYHCFTVHGLTSMLLTGYKEGSGIFVRLSRGQTGFTYNSSTEVETLRNKVDNDVLL